MKISIYKNPNSNSIAAYIKRSKLLENALDDFILHPHNSNIKLSCAEFPYTKRNRIICFWFSWLTKNIVFDFTNVKFTEIKQLHICEYDMKSYSMEDLKEFFVWFKTFNSLYTI